LPESITGEKKGIIDSSLPTSALHQYINILYMYLVEQECLVHVLFAEMPYADCALFRINL